MQTYLVSIISEHLIPNYLFIKEWEGRYDSLVFITTKEMESAGYSHRLEKALNLRSNSVKRIPVSEENLNAIKGKLNVYSWNTEDSYIVNITGGTKVMSIGCYDFFSRFNSLFYYIPIGKNKIKDVLSSEDISINYRLTLSEYLTLYGLTAEYESELTYPYERTRELFTKFKSTGFQRGKVEELRNAQILSESKDRKYFSGTWFEEYCYSITKREFLLSDNSIWFGVKLFRKDSGTENDNEVDVMFIVENELYVCECKMSLMKPGERDYDVLESYMYKLAAISKDFGLKVKPYILTLHKETHSIHNRRKSIEKRMNILGIKGFFNARYFIDETLWNVL